MAREEIVDFLRRTVTEIMERSGERSAPVITEATRILGSDGILSSLMLVELMLVVEDFCTERGLLFSWTDDSAMSERRSVYRTIETLADFMLSLPLNGSATGQEIS